MGGYVNVAFRFGDTLICETRHTSPTPFWFKNLRMMRGDPAYVIKYLEESRGLDPVMPATLSPHEYGLVVFDFDNNVLLSMQRYSWYDKFNSLEFNVGSAEHDRKRLETFYEFVRAGHIVSERIVFHEDRSETVTRIPVTSVRQAKRMIGVDKAFQTRLFFDREKLKVVWRRNFLITGSMTFVSFRDEPKSVPLFQDKLRELGFEITDHAAWENWRKED